MEQPQNSPDKVFPKRDTAGKQGTVQHRPSSSVSEDLCPRQD